MFDYYIVYDTVTGNELWRGSGPKGVTAFEQLPENAASVLVPQSVISQNTLNLNDFKTAMEARVDAEAEAARLKLITPGSGQILEYQEAIAEARAFLVDPNGSYPMLEADVEVGTIDMRTNLPVGNLAEAADLVLFMFNYYLVPGKAIRKARLGAKKAIRSAVNIGEIVTAAQIDWDNLPIS